MSKLDNLVYVLFWNKYVVDIHVVNCGSQVRLGLKDFIWVVLRIMKDNEKKLFINLKRSTLKMERKKSHLMFNETCYNNDILPKYTRITDTYRADNRSNFLWNSWLFILLDSTDLSWETLKWSGFLLLQVVAIVMSHSLDRRAVSSVITDLTNRSSLLSSQNV